MRKTLFVAAFAAIISYSTLAFAGPSAGQILDAYKTAAGGSAWDGKVTMRSEFTLAGYGLTGMGHAVNDLKNGRSESDYSMGPANGASGFDGTTPW